MATIYKLICEDPDLVYYGSTIQSLNERFRVHKCIPTPSAKKLFDVGGVEIVEIEKCNKEDRFLREQYYLDNFPCVNMKKAYISEEERKERDARWRLDNAERLRLYRKEYKQKNKRKIAENDKIKVLCECGSIFAKKNQPRHLRSPKHLNYLLQSASPS